MAKSSRRHRGNCASQSPQKRRVGGGPVDGSGERLYVGISWKWEWRETRKKLVQELANRRDKRPPRKLGNRSLRHTPNRLGSAFYLPSRRCQIARDFWGSEEGDGR